MAWRLQFGGRHEILQCLLQPLHAQPRVLIRDVLYTAHIKRDLVGVLALTDNNRLLVLGECATLAILK
jgi:hypothetical protein